MTKPKPDKKKPLFAPSAFKEARNLRRKRKRRRGRFPDYDYDYDESNYDDFYYAFHGDW